MRVLAITHAHLMSEGLSPVSCERVDSLVKSWVDDLGWEVYVVHTQDTKWMGIWPDGKGLNAKIVTVAAPKDLMMGPEPLFSVQLKSHLRQKNFPGAGALIARKFSKKANDFLSKNGWRFPSAVRTAGRWGQVIYNNDAISRQKFDFIFACVGHGDEYLLQTALTLSQRLKTRMIVDFRDLWSDHHDLDRFTDKQRRVIRKFEIQLLSNTILVSVPQLPMAVKLREFLKVPVHVTTHSAHFDPRWTDGIVIRDEFRMLYAGKIYAGNEGLALLLEVLQKLAGLKLARPVKCHFFIDDGEALRKLLSGMGIDDVVVIHKWVTPAEIWKEMRSAHLLLIFDGGFYQRMPLIMTKTYQYALSGRPILALSKYGNTTYETLFKTYDAGVVCSTVAEAVAYITHKAGDEQQYRDMPEMKKVPSRAEIAVEFGKYIEQLLDKQTHNS